MTHHPIGILFLSVTVFLGACSSNPTPPADNTGYRSTRAQTRLEIPPDLVNTTTEELKQAAMAPETTQVLPDIEGLEIVGEGMQRYLKVDAAANPTWAKLTDFASYKNFPIYIESKGQGVLETDWISDESIDSPTRSQLRVLFGNIAGRPPVNDRYKFWLERLDDASTAIHVEHSRLTKEVIKADSHDNNDKYVWQENAGNEFQMVSMLRELQAYFSGADQPQLGEMVQLYTEGKGRIVLAQGYDQAWEMVEQAIPGSNYNIVDALPDKNLFIVKEKKKDGFFAKMAYKPKRGILLEPLDSRTTRVTVTTTKGREEAKDVTLPLLYELAGELRK